MEAMNKEKETFGNVADRLYSQGIPLRDITIGSRATCGFPDPNWWRFLIDAHKREIFAKDAEIERLKRKLERMTVKP